MEDLQHALHLGLSNQRYCVVTDKFFPRYEHIEMLLVWLLLQLLDVNEVTLLGRAPGVILTDSYSCGFNRCRAKTLRSRMPQNLIFGMRCRIEILLSSLLRMPKYIERRIGYPKSPFTFQIIYSIISHHDILQLIGSLMLRSARIERKTQVGVARTSQGPAL